MIYELVTTKGSKVFPHWDSVAFLKDKESIKFSPGLNILFGGNGSGKSTIVNTLAHLMHCEQGGFQKLTEQSFRMVTKRIGDGFDLVDQTVIHDGMDTRFVSAERLVGTELGSQLDYDFIEGQISFMRAKNEMSSGQLSFVKVNRLFSEPWRKGPAEQKISSKGVNGMWKGPLEKVETFLKGTPREDEPFRMCFLLDEPDRSLDFKKQAMLWEALRSHNTTGMAQFIVATHSPFALDLPEANYIETEPGALDSMRGVLSSWGWTRTVAPPVTPLTALPKDPERKTKKRSL